MNAISDWSTMRTELWWRSYRGHKHRNTEIQDRKAEADTEGVPGSNNGLPIRYSKTGGYGSHSILHGWDGVMAYLISIIDNMVVGNGWAASYKQTHGTAF